MLTVTPPLPTVVVPLPRFTAPLALSVVKLPAAAAVPLPQPTPTHPPTPHPPTPCRSPHPTWMVLADCTLDLPYPPWYMRYHLLHRTPAPLLPPAAAAAASERQRRRWLEQGWQRPGHLPPRDRSVAVEGWGPTAGRLLRHELVPQLQVCLPACLHAARRLPPPLPGLLAGVPAGRPPACASCWLAGWVLGPQGCQSRVHGWH